jgi:hypothetical protein
VGDKNVVNQVVLGHEFNQLLNFKHSKIANPDKRDQLEWCSAENFFDNGCQAVPGPFHPNPS